MSIEFKVKSFLRERRWKKYWREQDNKNHVEFYVKLAREWREERPNVVGTQRLP